MLRRNRLIGLASGTTGPGNMVQIRMWWRLHVGRDKGWGICSGWRENIMGNEFDLGSLMPRTCLLRIIRRM